MGLGFLLAAAIASILVGPADLAPGAVLAEVVSKLPLVHVHPGLTETGAIVVWQLRMPRMVLGGLVGAMLALAGASYQGVFSNPLADPYLLGIASGAGLGATLVIVEGPLIGQVPTDALPVAAFAGGVVAVAATFALGRARAAGRSAASMLLAGVAVAAFFTAVQTFLLQQSSPGDLTVVYSWILGGLATAGWSQVVMVLPYIGVALAVLVAARRLLDVLAVGDEEATSLGVRAERVRLVVIIAATLGHCGGSLGQRAHRVRRHNRASHHPPPGRSELPPHTPAVGPVWRRVPYLCRPHCPHRHLPGEVPLGVVTAFLGAPFFLIVLRQSRRLT